MDSGLFDPQWYSATYRDVDAIGLEPLEHYLRIGIYAGRPPSPLFDVKHYFYQFAQAGREDLPVFPLVDYLIRGWKAGLN